VRYAVLHCRGCLRHIWVPQDKLGRPGQCPDCGEPMRAPADWPASQMVEGPHIMQDFVEMSPRMVESRGRAAAVAAHG